MNITQLMVERHGAYRAALAEEFRDAALNEVWRNANREYVLARAGSSLDTPKMLVAA
jgi:hypothetical protein